MIGILNVGQDTMRPDEVPSGASVQQQLVTGVGVSIFIVRRCVADGVGVTG
jgi:hypothetical protein